METWLELPVATGFSLRDQHPKLSRFHRAHFGSGGVGQILVIDASPLVMIQHFAIEPDVFAGSARLPTSHETMNHDPAAAPDDLLRAERLTKVHPDGNVMAVWQMSACRLAVANSPPSWGPAVVASGRLCKSWDCSTLRPRAKSILRTSQLAECDIRTAYGRKRSASFFSPFTYSRC